MDAAGSRASGSTLVRAGGAGTGRPPVPRAATEMLGRCDGELLASQLATDPSERFDHAHLAALRLAGSVLAASGARPPRGRARSAWQQLRLAEPEMAHWAAYFESGAPLRAAVAAGRPEVVDDALADRWVAAAEDFRDIVSVYLGDDPTVASVAPTMWAS